MIFNGFVQKTLVVAGVGSPHDAVHFLKWTPDSGRMKLGHTMTASTAKDAIVIIWKGCWRGREHQQRHHSRDTEMGTSWGAGGKDSHW